jgi:hypothetical protein
MSHKSWWVSADMYSLNFKSDEMTNIPDALEGIKAAIMDGTFDEKVQSASQFNRHTR